MASGKRMARFHGHRGPVYSVAFSPRGGHLLTGGGDDTVRLWDVAHQREAVCFTGHLSRVASVAFSPDGRFAASGSLDQTVRVWRVPK
jgi:WD40 repeat protein